MGPSYVACLLMFHVAILVNCGMVVRCGMFTMLVGVVSTVDGSVLVVSCCVDGGGGGVGVERPDVGRGGRIYGDDDESHVVCCIMIVEEMPWVMCRVEMIEEYD